MARQYTLFILCFLFATVLSAQSDSISPEIIQTVPEKSLLDELDEFSEPASTDIGVNIKKIKKQQVYNTFGGTHLINGQSTETIGKNVMAFIISHRFGKLNGSFYELFGLDQASVRFSFEYGILNNLTIGVARGSFNKTYDGYIKYRFLDQREKGFPFSMALYANAAINTLKNRIPNR